MLYFICPRCGVVQPLQKDHLEFYLQSYSGSIIRSDPPQAICNYCTYHTIIAKLYTSEALAKSESLRYLMGISPKCI